MNDGDSEKLTILEKGVGVRDKDKEKTCAEHEVSENEGAVSCRGGSQGRTVKRQIVLGVRRKTSEKT